MRLLLAVAPAVMFTAATLGDPDLCRSVKVLGFLLCILQSMFIIASRKHYSVDIVIAWYENGLNSVCFVLSIT